MFKGCFSFIGGLIIFGIVLLIGFAVGVLYCNQALPEKYQTMIHDFISSESIQKITPSGIKTEEKYESTMPTTPPVTEVYHPSEKETQYPEALPQPEIYREVEAEEGTSLPKAEPIAVPLPPELQDPM